ncbi:MAG: leucyl aminopeptidase [Gammaproteobacteria bacterium]
MKITLKDSQPHLTETPCLVIGVLEDAPLTGPAKQVDEASDGAISRLIESGDIDPDRNCTTLLHGLPGVTAERILVVGGGAADRFDRVRYHNMCIAAGKFLRSHAVTSAHVCLHRVEVEDLDEGWRLRQAVTAVDHANYLYVATKPLKSDSPRPLKDASFCGTDAMQPVLEQARGLCAGYRTARELGNLPPNICNPAYLAQQAKGIAERYDGCSIEILKRAEMAELGMDALLAVAQGSVNSPRLIILRYDGAGKDDKPYVLVGKGVTFDTGGISLKPRESMDEMKFDMCGAATVIGAFEAAAAMRLPVNLVTVVAAVENMPDGKAYRPGDVITSMSGKTIEVLNTDAEGRLALCDALTYSERFEPAAIIDVATLTGACVVALGHHASAVMSKHDDLAEELISAGQAAVDRAWRLPIWEDYNQQLKSPFADLQNIGGMPAGAITAGCFLAKFARNMRWAHVDIAGSAWKWNGKDGATGRPVGLLTQFLIDRTA